MWVYWKSIFQKPLYRFFVFLLQNFLNNFHVSNPLIVTARILLLFQLLTVFPLIMFILRSQIFMLISKNDNVGYCQIYMLNAALITICVLFAIFMPSIGNIIRYTGALCGAIVVFVLPSFVYMASAKKAGQLRPSTVCIHLSIILIGMVNFAAQFFIWNKTHYSKSQSFVQKFNFDKTPTFSRVFHPKFFW